LKKRWGGLRFLEGSPAATLDYCVVDNAFVGSSSGHFFSAVSVWKGTGITMSHCRISNNYSTNNGGGIYVKEGFVSIDNCLIVHNYQSNHAKGTGIFLDNSNDSKILNSVIAYNKCNLSGS
jgi:predicted outer membrane repeat protein